MAATPNIISKNVDEMLRHRQEAALMLKTMAHEARLMILCLLIKGEMSVGEINERVGLSQSALSQHLAVLRHNHLVKTRRQSQTIYYALGDKTVTRIIRVLNDVYCKANSSKTP